MPAQEVRHTALHVVGALTGGALAGYLAALVRPRRPAVYGGTYHAPHPDAVALPAGTRPAVSGAPVRARTRRGVLGR